MRYVFFLFLMCSAVILSAAEPVARYDFEGTTGLPENALNGKGKIEFVDGIKGKAIKMADNTLAIPCPAGISGESGSIAFWAKPVNWDCSSPEFVFFLFSQDKTGTHRMLVYKYRNPGGLGLTFWYGNPNDDKSKTIAAYRKADYKKGEWFFFVVTWSKQKDLTSLYYNGKRVTGSRPGKAVFFNELGDFVLNPVPFNPANRGNKTVFDMLRFYKEPLSSSEIEKMYIAEKPGK